MAFQRSMVVPKRLATTDLATLTGRRSAPRQGEELLSGARKSCGG